MLVEVVTGGGNLLLNVSPRGDGSLDPEHEARLLEVGQWMHRYGEFIYGTRGGPIKNKKEFGGFTHKGNALYFFMKSNAEGSVRIPLLQGRIIDIVCHTGEQLRTVEIDGIVHLSVEGIRDDLVTIVEIQFDQPVSHCFEHFDYESFDAFDNMKTRFDDTAL